jgi:hypothetical protein
VVEGTADTDFDGVTLDGLFATLQFQEFGTRRGTRAARWQPRTKDVGHFDEFDVRTDRTGFARSTSEVLRRAKQLRVRVTDVLVSKEPRRDLGQESVTHQTELDHCTIRGTRAEALIHYG